MRGAVVARLLGCLVAALLVMAPVHGPYPEPQPAAAPASAEHVTVDDSTRKDMDQAKNDIHELLLHMGEVQKTLKRLTDKRDNPPPVPSENNNSWLQMLILSSGQVAVVLIAIALWPIFRPRADPGYRTRPKFCRLAWTWPSDATALIRG